VVVAGSVLALAGCGGDGPQRDPEADQQRVDDAVLTVDDLPAGYTEEPVDDDDDDSGIEKCLDSELGLTIDDFEDARTARSEPYQFVTADQSLRARVSAFEDGDVPGEVIDAFDEDDFLGCLRDAVEADLADDIELTSVEAIDPAVGDETTAYQLRILFSSAGTAIESRLNAIQTDRFVVSLEATSLEGASDEAVMVDALDAMLARLEADG